jgi:hypothetical protein
VLEELDTNKNGGVDFGEFLTFMTRCVCVARMGEVTVHCIAGTGPRKATVSPISAIFST